MLVPVDEAEYAELHDSEDREAWYDARFSGPVEIAAQWTALLDSI